MLDKHSYVDKQIILKLLPFEKKVQYLERCANQTGSCFLVVNAIFSELLEELEIYLSENRLSLAQSLAQMSSWNQFSSIHFQDLRQLAKDQILNFQKLFKDAGCLFLTYLKRKKTFCMSFCCCCSKRTQLLSHCNAMILGILTRHFSMTLPEINALVGQFTSQHHHNLDSLQYKV